MTIQVETVESVAQMVRLLRELGTDAEACASLGLNGEAIRGDIVEAMGMSPAPRATELFLVGVMFGLHEGVRLMGDAACAILEGKIREEAEDAPAG